MRTLEQRQILRQADAIKRDERKANKKGRPKSEKATRGRKTNNGHLAQIRQLPCIATLVRTGLEVYGVDAAHVRYNYPVVGWGGNPGLGTKPHDWRTVPLTRAEHKRQHDRGDEAAYWTELGVYPPSLCAALRLVSSVELKLDVIRQYAAAARERTIRIPAGKRKS